MTDHTNRILVAEDNIAMGGVIRFNLERAGFDVTLVRSGKAAWELLDSDDDSDGADFDLVVSDFQMPEMTGGELCERMRKSPRLAELPMILLTAKGFELNESRLKEELALSTIMFKPFSPRELVETVKDCLTVGVAEA